MFPQGTQVAWLRAASAPPLEQHGVQVWRIHTGYQGPASEADLFEEDLPRYQRLQQASAKRQMVLSRYLLRQAIALITKEHPGEVRLTRSATGAPVLEAPIALPISITHQGEWILLAIGNGCTALGIDVESLAPVPEYKLILSDWAHQSEQHLVLDAGMPAFLSWWTRLESLGKCLGTGLEESIQQAAVLQPNIEVDGNAIYLGHTHIDDYEGAAPHVLGWAISGPQVPMHFIHWQ